MHTTHPHTLAKKDLPSLLLLLFVDKWMSNEASKQVLLSIVENCTKIQPKITVVETDTHIQTQTHIQTHTDTDTHRHTHTHRHTQTHTHTHIHSSHGH